MKKLVLNAFLLASFLVSSAFFFVPAAQAFYTVQETGDLLKPNQMQIATELQAITSGDDGINVIGRFDKGLDEEINLRFEVGFGTTDSTVGAYIKWVPIPDYESQPAIGFTFGAHIANYEDETEFAGRVIPFVSKQFDTDWGLVTPYAALPFAFSQYDDESQNPFFLVLGSRYKHPEFQYCDFTAELGFEISDSFTYLSLGAIFPAFE